MSTRLLWTNLLTASGVVITSSSEATGYVDDYVANTARFKKWRSATSSADQWIKFDLGSNQAMTALAAVSYLIPAGVTFKMQAHTSDAWVTPTKDITIAPGTPDLTGVLVSFFNSVSLRWVRFFWTGLTSDYVELALGFAGTYLEPSAGIAPGVSVVHVDPSVERRAIGGQRSSVVRPKYHEVNGVWRQQVASARDDLRNVFNTTGGATPVIFALDHATASLIWYGAMEARLEQGHLATSADQWNIPFRFREDVP